MGLCYSNRKVTLNQNIKNYINHIKRLSCAEEDMGIDLQEKSK